MTRRFLPILLAVCLVACGSDSGESTGAGSEETGRQQSDAESAGEDQTPEDAVSQAGSEEEDAGTPANVEPQGDVQAEAGPDITEETSGDGDAVDEEVSEETGSGEETYLELCGVNWPEDPFQAAVYAFVAEYVLNLGPMVGCFLDEYPDQTFAWLAETLEEGWASGGAAEAVTYAQQWVDANAADNGQEGFDLVVGFKLVVQGASVSEGLGAAEGGGSGNTGNDDGSACAPSNATSDDSVAIDSYFEIQENPMAAQGGMKCLTRYVNVFGLSVVAESALTTAQVLHGAAVLAELLDNDEDGVADDPALLTRLQDVKAVFPMFNAEGSPAYSDFESNYAGHGVSAVLFANEVDPTQPGHWGADATVEETMHTINHRGHVSVYPDAFGLEPGSSLLTAAMDVARGGQFMSIPSSYPDEAWYHYDDETCDYQCMATEYIYWAQVSNMGILDDAQTCAGIANEWEPCSKALLESMDTLVYALITDPQYKLPQSAPDGVYSPPPE